MTSLITQPQILATAAADASAIGSALDEAKAAAAGPTTSLMAAAEDEVSAITAQLFGAYGQECQALLQQAAAFHDQFVATLAAAGSAYAQAEAEIAGTLGLTGGAVAGPVFGAVTQVADPITVDAILIMSGSGFSTPPVDFMNEAYNLYLTDFTGPLQAVSTAEGLYPFTGVKDLTLDTSLARGVIQLDNAITAVLGPAPARHPPPKSFRLGVFRRARSLPRWKCRSSSPRVTTRRMPSSPSCVIRPIPTVACFHASPV